MSTGRWISIDGVEAAGKTTLVRGLSERLRNVVVVDEFCDDPVSRFLRETVKEHPHVYSKSLVGQSLVFLGEFWQRFDSAIRPALDAGATVISDRGYLSKYTYQFVVMEPAIGASAAQSLLAGVLEPMPRPAVSVVLSAPIDVLRTRLIERGESCDKLREAFIVTAMAVFAHPMLGAGKRLTFDTSLIDATPLADSVAEAI